MVVKSGDCVVWSDYSDDCVLYVVLPDVIVNVMTGEYFDRYDWDPSCYGNSHHVLWIHLQAIEPNGFVSDEQAKRL